MRELWLSLGFWMIFGLPSGETTRREKPSPASDKPAAVQQATPARAQRVQRNAPAEAPPAETHLKANKESCESSKADAEAQPPAETPGTPTEAPQSCILPPSTQVYH